MDVRITKPVSGGSVRAITSKSDAHRLLICAALVGSKADKNQVYNKTFITCPQRSEDIDATIRCLESLGANIRFENDKIIVTSINRFEERDLNRLYTLNCGESGATLRFLLPVCGALGYNVSFEMSGRLPSRPLSDLYNEMMSHGCRLSAPGSSPLTCEGQLTDGTYILPGNITSQFISGLLFALPLLSGESIIQIDGVLESRPYIDMTLDALRSFGITIIERKQLFYIPGYQTFCSPQTVHVEGDWSNAAFWLSAGAIGKNFDSSAGAVTCTGLKLNSRQGDKAIVDLLKRFGANVVCENDSVTVSTGKLKGIDIDASDIPDLVPVLAAVATISEGKTIIYNAGRLRMKESDRLNTVATTLSTLGADITETEDGLEIIGKKVLTGGEIKSFGDHRIAMTAAVVSAACAENVIIRDAEAVKKSYPGFFNDFNDILGGVCEII